MDSINIARAQREYHFLDLGNNIFVSLLFIILLMLLVLAKSINGRTDQGLLFRFQESMGIRSGKNEPKWLERKRGSSLTSCPIFSTLSFVGQVGMYIMSAASPFGLIWQQWQPREWHTFRIFCTSALETREPYWAFISRTRAEQIALLYQGK